MRMIFAMVLLMFVTATMSSGQETSVHVATTAELLTMLRSDDAVQRADAYERLRSRPTALHSARVRSALLELLDRENSLHESAIREHVGISDKYGEGYTEYAYALGVTVASLIDWNDSHEVCIVVRGFAPDDAIANHAKTTIPCLIQKAKSDLGLVRGSAVAVLVEAMAKKKSDLDTRTIEVVQQVIRSGLRDPDDDVRTKAVDALEHFGSEDMIPALQEVAERDPSAYGEYAIRKAATEAIAAIRKRSGQN